MVDEAAVKRGGKRGWVPTRATLFTVALVLTAVGLCYFGALGCGFAYDDHDLINGNDYLKGWMAGAPDPQGRAVAYVSRMLTADFATLAQRFGREVADQPINYYRPVIAVSYMVDTLFWASIPVWQGPPPGGERTLEWATIHPFGYHLTNLLFHALNSLLVFLLARSLFRRHSAALAAAVVFAVHPMHTESVTWIAGRTDVVATTFFLAAFWGYVRYRRSGSRLALGTTLALFAVGMFAKEMVAVLPLALAAWELLRASEARVAGRPVGFRDLLRRLAPALLLASLVLPYFALKAGLAPSLPANAVPPEAQPWYGVSFGTILLSLPAAINWYVVKLLVPFSFNIFPMLWFVNAAAVGAWLPWLALHVLALGGALWTLLRGRRGQWAAFLILAGYLSLAPLSCLVPGLRLARFSVDIDFPVSERFLYIPSIFLALGVGLAVLRAGWFVSRPGRLALGVTLAAITLAAAVVCGGRNADWASNLTLFRSAVRASPESIRMRLNYAAALSADAWEVREGRLNYLRGLALAEERPGAYTPPELHEGLANVYYLERELRQAIDHLRTAWYQMGRLPEHGNRFAVTLSVYGSITANAAWLEEAVRVFEVVLARSGGHRMAADSARFCAATIGVWNDYLRSGGGDDEVVRRYASSFLLPARSLAEEVDPLRRLQALQILDSGLRRLPEPAAPAALPRARQERAQMVAVARSLYRDLDDHFAELLRRFPARPALRFLRAEVNRIAGLRLGDAAARDRALGLYTEVLAAEPDHAQAALGLIELAAAGGGDREAARSAGRRTAALLLDRERSWEQRPLPTRPVKAVQIAARLTALDPAGESGFHREILGRALGDLEQRARARRGGGDADSWNTLAVMEVRAADALGETARLTRAAEHLRTAHRISPQSAPILINLVQVLGRLGRHGEAREMQRRLEALGRPAR